MRFLLPGLLVLAIAPVARPADATPTDTELKAMDLVAASGGKADIDPKLPPTARVVARFESATDAVLLGLKKSPEIGALDVFDATRCTEKGFAALKELPHLRKLTLGKSEMTAARTTALGQCKELRFLYLANAGLTDPTLIPLKKLVLLEELDLSENPRITDFGMASVKSLERLRSLNLSKTAITDKGLFELKSLDGLRTLLVVGTRVTNDGAEKFTDEMPNLRIVRR